MNSIKTLLLNLLILHSFLYSNAQNNLEMVDSSIVKLNKFEIEQIKSFIKKDIYYFLVIKPIDKLIYFKENLKFTKITENYFIFPK